MVERGLDAWATPRIDTYGRWISGLLHALEEGRQAYCLGPTQARVLWEECIAAELGDQHTNLGAVVRAAVDAWKLVHAYGVPLNEISSCIDSRDQRVFARAALRYAERLREQGWLDEALLNQSVVAALEGAPAQRIPQAVMLAGFDRLTPSQELLIERLQAAGADVRVQAQERPRSIRTLACPDAAAECRAAGAWARERLLADPAARVGIVISGLERDPAAAGRLVREGFVPGWQTAPDDTSDAVNVSLGQALENYPMIAVALLIIRWLHDPLTSRQLGVLLRCSFLGTNTTDGRARLEIELRSVAARDWTPARLLKVFSREEVDPDTADFLRRVEQLAALLESQPTRSLPGHWAQLFDRALTVMGWPGTASLDSREHQLMNRWRELLGELAALEIVTGPLGLGAAADRLRRLARETVFQPEDIESVLSVLGPLEAAGLHFDALWIAGLDAETWPGAGGATPLLSRDLQRRYGLPDSTPEDTLAFATTVMERLSSSANVVVGSYAVVDGDSEQGPSLLQPVELTGEAATDPGWHAENYRAPGLVRASADDRVPPVEADEQIRGGSATINAQLSEPFAAFARGRLGLSSLDPFAEGLTPLLRGNLIHDALRFLYDELPSQADIRSWVGVELDDRIARASAAAVRRHRVAAGGTLERLLDFEQARIAGLLRSVVAVDCERPAFRVESVEGASPGRIGGLELRLRHDRLDTAADGSLVILDYKTGAEKKFFEKGEPRDYQLVLYAATAQRRVSDIGLYNVDSRQVAIDGAGVVLNGDTDFDTTLAGWFETIEAAVAAFRKGDVRVNAAQAVTDARWHGLLSRFQELVRNV